jgi:aspartyl protease family protein
MHYFIIIVIIAVIVIIQRIADGSIHEGTIVALWKVEIGNRKLSKVQASIVDNMEAPLLLGQSALAAFGKISIDYKRNEITFE